MGDRRVWTDEEIEALMCALEDMVVAGFRADAGSFKPGTYSNILGKMKEKIPSCEMQSSNIRNKMKKMKEKYTACFEMLQQSGFGWDDDKKCVLVDSKEVLEAYKKQNPKAAYQCRSPFPQYNRLLNIFGKDHAKGKGAINLTREKEKCSQEQQNETDGDTVMESGDSPTTFDSSASSRKGKRPRENDPYVHLVKSMEKFLVHQKEGEEKLFDIMKGKSQKTSEDDNDGHAVQEDEWQSIKDELARLLVPKTVAIAALYTMQREPKQMKVFWRLDDEEKVLWAERLAKD